jgi:hypothetical protein
MGNNSKCKMTLRTNLFSITTIIISSLRKLLLKMKGRSSPLKVKKKYDLIKRGREEEKLQVQQGSNHPQSPDKTDHRIAGK